jgi:hypothetical protein
MNRSALLSFFLVLLIAVSSAFSYEYGLTLTNDTTGVFEDSNQLEQNNRATGWFNLQNGPYADLHISLFYEFDGVFSADSSDVVPWRFDLGRTEYTGYFALGPGRLRYALGRIQLSDYSARVLTGLSDGLRTEYQLGNATFFLTSAYRGLLYKEDANSYLDADDLAILADDDEFFAPKRIVVGTGARLNEFLPYHDFGLEGWAQFDVDDGDTTMHTQYIEPFIEGRIGRQFRWRSWTAVEFGTADSETYFAMGAGFRLRYSAPELSGLLVTGTALWASGDNGSFDAFTPVKQGSVASVSSLAFSDASKLGLDVAISPGRGLSASLGGAALFRSSQVGAPDGTLRDDADGYYLGTEITTQGSVRPTTDLLISLWGGVLIPNTSLYVSDTPNLWKVGLSIVFNL